MRYLALLLLALAVTCRAAAQDLSIERGVIPCGACQLAVGRLTWELLEAFRSSSASSEAVCRYPNENISYSCGAQMPELRESLHFGALQACYIGGTTCWRDGEAKHDDVLQRSALEQLYMLTGGPLSWRRRDGWLSRERSYCSWEGVKCDGSRQVVALSLAENGLQGGLHGFVPQHLPALSSLRLEGNQLVAISSWWHPPASLKNCSMAGNPLSSPPPRGAASLCGASSAVVLSRLGKRRSVFPTAAPVPTNGSFPLHGGGDISWGSIFAPIYQGPTNGSRDDVDQDNDNNNNNNDDNNNNNNNGLVVIGDNNTVEYENYNYNINLNLNHNGNANHNSNSSSGNTTSHHYHNNTGGGYNFTAWSQQHNSNSSRKALIASLAHLATLMQRSDWNSLIEAFQVAATAATAPRHRRKGPSTAEPARRASRDESTLGADTALATNGSHGNGSNHNEEDRQHGAPPQQMDDGGVFNVDSIFGPIFGGATNGPRTDVDNDNDNNNNNNGDNNNDNNNQLLISGSNNAIKYRNKNINFNFNPNWNDNDNENRDT